MRIFILYYSSQFRSRGWLFRFRCNVSGVSGHFDFHQHCADSDDVASFTRNFRHHARNRSEGAPTGDGIYLQDYISSFGTRQSVK